MDGLIHSSSSSWDVMRERGWRYLLVSVPLGWCGIWVGGILSLLLVPIFAVAAISAARRSQHLFLIYAAPPCVMTRFARRSGRPLHALQPYSPCAC